MNAPRAGQLAQPSDLVDVASLVTAYYTRQPDPENVDEQVAFGTSGHRGSSLKTSFNEAHILATTQAICEYRREQGFDGPLFIGRDTHGLSEPAWATALEVLVANDVTVLVDSRDRYTPTPAVSHAILTANRGKVTGVDGMPAHAGLADGIVVTPSHNPPSDGGFKYNPPHGGPADSDATKVIAARANELIRAGLEGVKRVPFARARAAASGYDFLGTYVDDLPARARHRRDPRVRPAHRRRPARRGVGRLLGRHRRAARPRPHGGQPARRRHLAVHDARLGRQDPDGLLLTVGDGQPDRPARRLRHRHRQRRGCRPARHRDPGCRPAQPQPLPRRRDPVPLRRRAARSGATTASSARRWCRAR